jgi:hypothetical protein
MNGLLVTINQSVKSTEQLLSKATKPEEAALFDLAVHLRNEGLWLRRKTSAKW